MSDPKQVKIYLAHSPSDQKRGRRIQKELETEGYSVINPFDDQVSVDISVVPRDIIDIIESDILVCLYPQHLVTVGMDQEIVYAHLFRTFVITFVPEELVRNVWLRYHSDLVFTTDREKDIMEILESLKLTVEERK